MYDGATLVGLVALLELHIREEHSGETAQEQSQAGGQNEQEVIKLAVTHLTIPKAIDDLTTLLCPGRFLMGPTSWKHAYQKDLMPVVQSPQHTDRPQSCWYMRSE